MILDNSIENDDADINLDNSIDVLDIVELINNGTILNTMSKEINLL